MKKILAILMLAAVAASAQTTPRVAIQTTNGVITSPHAGGFRLPGTLQTGALKFNDGSTQTSAAPSAAAISNIASTYSLTVYDYGPATIAPGITNITFLGNVTLQYSNIQPGMLWVNIGTTDIDTASGGGITNITTTSPYLTVAMPDSNTVTLGLSGVLATAGQWNAQIELASNRADTAYGIATGAVQAAGGAMTGTLTAPKIRGTNTVFTDWRSTVGTYDGRIVHGAATVADGGQVGMSIIGDAGGTGDAIELGPFYSGGTIFGGGFIRMSGSDPVNLGRAMSFGFHPVFGTGSQQTTAIVKVYSSSDSALWARRYEGNASGLTNLAASELNAATSFVRGVGGEMTGVLTNFAGFVGNGAGLTNLPASGASANPFTNFYINAVASPTNRFQFTVPTNELWSRIEINLTAYQTNDAAQGFVYFRINGATGTNVLHAYQIAVFSGTTPSQTPGIGSGSNDASGAYSGRMWAPHNYSNAACRVSITLHDIYDPYPAKTYFANSWTKPRTGSGSANQYLEQDYGSVSIGGPVTGVEVLAIGTLFDTGTVLRVRGMP